jgi:23S rRNA pseudouridine1911/1915/1917 synthase
VIVVNKPAGLVVHPAPGAESGTLVNALLHHCGDRIEGVGGARRPGIVHRIDKDTSGLMVVAKTDRAHAALSAASRRTRSTASISRSCGACRIPAIRGSRGCRAWLRAGGVIRIEGGIGRHPTDRKRMAVVGARGRRAVTRVRVLRALRRRGGAGVVPAGDRADAPDPGASRPCRASAGGRSGLRAAPARPASVPQAVAAALAGFPRQALHAARLGFAIRSPGRPWPSPLRHRGFHALVKGSGQPFSRDRLITVLRRARGERPESSGSEGGRS